MPPAATVMEMIREYRFSDLLTNPIFICGLGVVFLNWPAARRRVGVVVKKLGPLIEKLCPWVAPYLLVVQQILEAVEAGEPAS